MSKTKELIICIISIIALILAVTTTVFASDTQDISSLMGDNTSNTENNDFQQIGDTTNNTNNNSTNTNVTATTTNNTNTNSNVNKTATIPYTGIDYSVLLIIAICGVSAVYAYKKIRDYNV